jgi:hypothetical protein
MDSIRMVAISGRGNSLFSNKLGDIWSQGSPFLGQTGVGNYTQTKADVAAWDALVARLQRVANASVRQQIANDFGISNPGDKDKGQYLRDRSAKDIALADASKNYDAFSPSTPGPTKHDAAQLESFLGDFQKAVQSAETTYGQLDTPQVITQVVPGALPSWVLPVGIGVAGLALLGAFGIIRI